MIDMFLPVKPIPKARPRFTDTGNVYTKRSTINAQNQIAYLVKSEMNNKGILLTERPVIVDIVFCFNFPKSKLKLVKILSELYSPYMCSRPDLDNLVKLAMDALNGIVYKDDAQIVKLRCEKRYADDEGIHLKIVEL